MHASYFQHMQTTGSCCLCTFASSSSLRFREICILSFVGTFLIPCMHMQVGWNNWTPFLWHTWHIGHDVNNTLMLHVISAAQVIANSPAWGAQLNALA